MRLDKFLKVSRIIKRRPIAKIVIDSGKAKLDNKIAKSSTEVKVGQILELEYYNKYLKFKILQVPNNNISKDKTNELIEILDSRGIDKNINLDRDEEVFEKI